MTVRRSGLVVAALLTLSSVACSDGGEPLDPSDPVAIGFSDPSGSLAALRATIESHTTAASERVRAVLTVGGTTITIVSDPTRAIAGYGIGGRTFSDRTVEIYVDPGYPEIASVIATRLEPLVVHELHHIARFRGPGYGSTLLEAMVSEGMADRFAIELLGAPIPPWSDAFPRDSTAQLLSQATPEFDSASYDHARWFFGSDPSLPRWAGYTLGYRLVEAYQDSHPGATATALVGEPAGSFRP